MYKLIKSFSFPFKSIFEISLNKFSINSKFSFSFKIFSISSTNIKLLIKTKHLLTSFNLISPFSFKFS